MPHTALGPGRGHAHGHHGELLQGIFRGPDGILLRGLFTLPCHLFLASAECTLAGGGGVTIAPAWKKKALRAAELTFHTLGTADQAARISITSNTPVQHGFGSSTSDVVATIRAVANALGAQLDAAAVALLAVQAERASDPLMFDGSSLLFAHRNGFVIEDFGYGLGPLGVLGFFTSEEKQGVQTPAAPQVTYAAEDVELFDRLRDRLRWALRNRDMAEVGRVATASATRNQLHLAVPRFGELKQLMHGSGAAGIQVAHSGDIAGLLFDLSDPSVDVAVQHARAGLEALGIGPAWWFQLGDHREGPAAPVSPSSDATT